MNTPEALNKEATAIFRKLIDGLSRVGDSQKIGDGSSYMAVHVEIIGTAPKPTAKIVSVAHYFEQHGDLCCDPDMTFLATEKGEVYPMTFEQQGGLPVYQVAMQIKEDGVQLNAKLQRELVTFANQWMMNICEQQSLS